jgi:C4-dicarboxylate transporter DctM subunit
MILLLALGMPIAFTLGMSSVVYLLVTGAKPLILVAQRTVLGTDSFPLLAIPLFTLGGYLMETGGLSKRLVNFIEKMMGSSPSSVGNVTIICCTLFAALTARDRRRSPQSEPSCCRRC